MLVKDMILEQDKNEILLELHKNGFTAEYNRYAPFSMFFTKELKGNKTFYVREDIELTHGRTHYSFETWERDNTKDILAKDLDKNNTLYYYKQDISTLIATIRAKGN